MSIKIIDLVYKADLPRAEKAILLAYADHADDNGKSIYPSYGRIAWKTGYHRVHVIRITRRLIDSGILVVCGVHPSGTNILRIDLDRLPSRPDYNAITDTADAVDKPPIHNPDGESEILPEQVQIATPQVTNCYPTQLQNVTPPVAKCYPPSNKMLPEPSFNRIKEIKSVKTRANSPANAGARESESHTLNVVGGVGGDSPPRIGGTPAAPPPPPAGMPANAPSPQRVTPANAPLPPERYTALMSDAPEAGRWSWLRHEMRPLAQAFLAAAGERYYPHDESLRKLWRREIARWIAAGVDGRILSDTVSQMRRQGLAITGPQSVTGMAINYLEQRRAAQDEFPLFIAPEAGYGSAI